MTRAYTSVHTGKVTHKIFLRARANVNPFLDDGVIKGAREKDETMDSEGIRRFVRDHVRDTIVVLGTLQKAGLTVNGSKCHWGITAANVLGFRCSEQGREPSREGQEKIMR